MHRWAPAASLQALPLHWWFLAATVTGVMMNDYVPDYYAGLKSFVNRC